MCETEKSLTSLPSPRMKMLDNIHGRVLYVQGDREMLAGHKNVIHRSVDLGEHWSRVGILPVSGFRKVSGQIRLLARLLRHEPRAVAVSKAGSMIAATREGIFWAGREERTFHATRLPDLGRRIYPPMTITADHEGRFIWGEYWGNPQRVPVGLFVSQDGGQTHELVHEFPTGEIRHIHQIYQDPKDRSFWVLTGDLDGECGFLQLSSDFKRSEWFIRGNQRARCVVAFFREGKIIYGTDTEKGRNFILCMDRSTGKVEELCELPGSCIYGTQAGKYLVLSTTVEPSEFIKTNQATLWISPDGVNWKNVWQAEKDRWPGKYFQYGSILLPRGQWACDRLLASGQALKEYDGNVLAFDLNALYSP